MSSTRTRGALALVAIVAAAAASLPATAALPAPALVASAPADGGWKFSGATSISATYNTYLDPTSTMTLARGADPVAGSVSIENVTSGDPAEQRGIIRFTPSAALTEASYTATVGAVALIAPPSQTAEGTTSTSIAFKVDLLAPKKPVITAPSGPDAPPVFTPANEPTFEGTAADADRFDIVNGQPVANTTFTSGIHAVELHFYNPAMNRPSLVPPTVDPGNPNATAGSAMSSAGIATSSLSREVAAYRVNNACPASGSCATWSSIVANLPPGLWAVRAQVIDRSGNRSPESDHVSFVKA